MSLALSGFATANLTATSAGKTFTVTGWTGTGSLKGAGGATVIDADSGSFTLTNSQLTAPSTTLSLTGITTADLTDTSANGGNSFTVSGWTGKGTLTGNQETLVDAVTANTTLTDTSLAVTGGPTLTLGGFTTANVTDTAGGHVFTVSAWTGGGSLTNTGGAGDTVTASKALGYTLSNTRLSSGDGMNLGLSGFATANLTDSSTTGGNTFTINGWTGGGSLKGTLETLVDSVASSVTLANPSLAATGGPSVSLSGFSTANLTDAAGGNTFTVSDWTGSGTLTNSGSSSDTIAATKNAGFMLTNASLASTDKMLLTLSGIGTANLTATSSGRTFTVTGWTGNGSLTGAGTGDTVVDADNGSFTLSNSQLIAPSTILSLTDITTANLTDSSASGGNTFTVSGWTGKGTLSGTNETLVDTVAANTTLTNTTLAVTGGPSLMLAGFTSANLTDTAGGNTFTVSGWTGSGALTNSGSSSNTIAATKSASYTLTNASLASTDNMSLALSGFGTANLTATSAGKTFAVTGWTGTGSLKGAGDTVIDSDSGSFTLTSSQLTAPSTTLSLTGITTADLTDSSAGGSTFTVSAWTGKGTLAGTNETLVDLVAANTTLTNTSLAVTGGPTMTLGGFTTSNLTDTAGGHIFTLSGWTGGGSLTNTGTIGGDTVTASKVFGYTLSNTGVSSGDGMNLGLSGFATANLTDSSTTGGNTFTISGWTGGGSLKGKLETVVDDVAAGTTLTNTSLAVAGGPSLNLSGFTTANLTDTFGGSTFTVSGWTGSGALTDSGSPGDTIAATKNAGYTLTNTSLFSTDNMLLKLSGITTANLSATASTKTFTVTGWTGNGTLSGTSAEILTATETSDTTLMNTALTVSGGPNLNLSGFATANLTMGSSAGNSSWIDASGYSLGATNLIATGGGNVILYGGIASKSTLTAAGTGDDILIGNGAGDTLIDTGSGMNILIGGGGGGDTLTGNGNDILVSGATQYDGNTSANIAALDAVLAEWTSGDPYSTRIDNIMSGVEPGNADALSPSTITQDAKANVLQDRTSQTQFGNWFLYWSNTQGKDTVKKNSAERQTLL
jgi:hypothetical protein